jgi:hypothetical protein
MTIKSNRQVLHEQIAQGKIKQFDIQDYTATKMKRLSEKTIKDIHNNLRKRTLERLKGLYKAGFITKEEVENYRMEPTWTQFETIDQAIMSIGKYARFLSDIRKSTVTGRRAHLEATIEGLQESGWDFIDQENIDDFIEFQESTTAEERAKWYEVWDKADPESQTRPFALERYFREYQLNKGTISFEQLPEHFKEDFKKVNGVYTLRRPKR